MMKFVLAIQSFGKESEYKRAAFTVFSLFAYRPIDNSVQVLIFTDAPEWFQRVLVDLPIQYIRLSPEKIKVMRGEIDFLHRMKIALIEEAFQLYPQHKLIYADSDTFFTANSDRILAQITPDCASMHLWEYQFAAMKDMALPAGKTFQAFYQLIQQQEFVLADATRIKISPQMSSWNAGLMFFHPEHKRFIPDVYSLTDQFYPSTENHASEQYAFSIVLQQQTRLIPCAAINYHYWYRIKKQIADEFLQDKFNDAFVVDSIENKLDLTKRWTQILPKLFEEHIWMLQDNAVQAFNENRFKEGYQWAFRVFLRKPFANNCFFKDVLYHTKRLIFNR
jgi:hypothetical protein